MTLPPALHLRFDGEAFIPKAPRFAEKHYKAGETYRMVTEQERSRASHDHYFARLRDIWMNLPEMIAENFPSVEHLRKRALIDVGYYDEEIIDCGIRKGTVAVAAAIRKRDDFALVFVREQFVIIRVAKSQSLKAMGPQAFQDSKDKVLALVCEMVGVAPDQITAAA